MSDFNILIHISLASFLWDIDKQNSPRCFAASHLGLFCLLTGNSSKSEIKMLLMPLKMKVHSSK